MEIIDGELWVYYTDGTNQNLGSVGSGSGEEEGSVLEFILLPDGTYGVRAGEKAKDVAVIEIPDTYNGKAVTQILAGGFLGLSKLQEVILPDSLKSVGNEAFKGCTILEHIHIPDSVTSIGAHAFFACTYLDISISDSTWNFIIPSVEGQYSGNGYPYEYHTFTNLSVNYELSADNPVTISEYLTQRQISHHSTYFNGKKYNFNAYIVEYTITRV